MKNERILNALGKINDDMIADAKIGAQAKKTTPQWVRWVAMAACLCLIVTASALIAPLFGGEPGDSTIKIPINPLVITVYAKSEDGTMVPTALKLGEKVKMYPQKSNWMDDFEGYAINLTVLDAKYVTSRAVDENWKTILYPGDSTQYDMDEDCNWALSQGDDIWWVWLDEDGKVIPPGVDELLSPKLKGSEILWRPNTKGHNRSIIGVFDEEYDLLAVYYLEITEENAEYYAEVVKITNEFPPR